MASFNWEDPFCMDDQLSDDERMIRDTARSYAKDKLLTRVRQAYRDEHFHREIMTEMGEMGLLGVTILTNMVASEQTTFPTGWSRVKWSGWSNPYFSAVNLR